MFRPAFSTQDEQVNILIDDEPVLVPKGITATAAMLYAGKTVARTTAIKHDPRGPFCLMGVCHECLMEINGVPNQQACLVTVEDGMHIRKQHGAVNCAPAGEEKK